jgi:SagB-type dehydrogenase family enzyme
MTGEEGLGEQRSHEIGRQFMERTRYQYLGMSDQQKGLPQPPLEVEAGKTDTVHNLPAPADIEVAAVDLREAIEARTSVRKYARRPLTLAELSYLLWCTQGVKRVEGGYVTLRTVPSAGARHALETYLLVNNVEGLSPGLYHFLATEHKLVEVNLQADIANEIAGACWGQSFVKTSAVTFIWVAVVYRMTWRYGQRGYRYLHLDAGHVCQNLYLAAQSVGGGVCAVAAFSDEDMNRLLGVDGEEQFVIYIAAVGVKQ